ncbi:hypothetical protein DNTS_028623 [Danionella cerebrum]|uniref:Cell division cycle associated 5 n=1 Tax=Danionella cerebrum TaxID=2873325 RepID=A0A553MUA3_9TELE|nr:hypothetical protein DNTS_028623 [Danionella translucida]
MSRKSTPLSTRKSAPHGDSIGKSPAKRRSSRLSANGEKQPSEVVVAPVAVKRSITVRKIMPRKTQVLSNSNKENVPAKLSKILTSSPAAAVVPKTALLSPILPNVPQQKEPEHEQDPVWSQKVRRSYSRLCMGDKSFESPKSQSAASSSPHCRETLFGFERLQTPEVMRKQEGSRTAPLGSASFLVGSFNISAAAADDGEVNAMEVDPNIPGVCVGKKRTKRNRVKQLKMSELDYLAAQMNAEFEEAETFELVVE